MTPEPPNADLGLPWVSVVVPSWNRAEALRAVLGNLLAQHYPPNRYEIVVVDDGSTDETPDVVRTIQAQNPGNPQIHYVRQPHRRLNAARNTGLLQARGDPICFLDDDTEVPPGWLEAMARGVLEYPAADCIGGPIRLRLEASPPRLCGRESLGEAELDLGSEDRLLHPQIGISPLELVGGGNMAIRRRAVDRVGPFDESIPNAGDDFEWELRLHRRGGSILYAKDAWLWHRRTAKDLRLKRLLRGRLKRGIGSGIWERRVGWPSSTFGHVGVAARMLIHGLRFRCAYGLLSATFHLGSAYGLLVESRRVTR